MYGCLHLLKKWKSVYFPGQTSEDYNSSADSGSLAPYDLIQAIFCHIVANNCLTQILFVLNRLCSVIFFFSVQRTNVLFQFGFSYCSHHSVRWPGWPPPFLPDEEESIPLSCLLLLPGAAALGPLLRCLGQLKGMERGSLRWDNAA